MIPYDNRICELGEGPLWHPERGQLFWFDILGCRLLTRAGSEPMEWSFDRHVSAAGWIDATQLMIATERDLIAFDIAAGTHGPIASLEADDPSTRSNDGRADPQGGFWIGTMGKRAEPGRGAIYRYYRGEVRRLFDGITIPNAICFTPDGGRAYFADTAQRIVWCQALDAQGWPNGAAEVFLDQNAAEINPDGAVVDAEGRFWNAEWGNSRVAAYDASGRFVDALPVPARQPSCPAFGGPDLSTLFVTTAREHLGSDAGPADGQTYAAETAFRGQPEPAVIL